MTDKAIWQPVTYKYLVDLTYDDDPIRLNVCAVRPDGNYEVVASVFVDDDRFPGGLSLDDAEEVTQLIRDHLNGKRQGER